MQIVKVFDIAPNTDKLLCELNEKETITACNSTDHKVSIVYRGKLPEELGGANNFDVKLNGRVVRLDGDEGDLQEVFGTFTDSVFFNVVPKEVGELFPNVAQNIKDGDVVIQEKDSTNASTVMIVQAEGEGDVVVPRWHS